MSILNGAASSPASFSRAALTPSFKAFSAPDRQEGISLAEFQPIAAKIGIKPEDTPIAFNILKGSEGDTPMDFNGFAGLNLLVDFFDKLDNQNKKPKGFGFSTFLESLTGALKGEQASGKPVNFASAQKTVYEGVQKQQQASAFVNQPTRPLTEVLGLAPTGVNDPTSILASAPPASILAPVATSAPAPAANGGGNKWLGFLGLAVGVLGIFTSKGVSMAQKVQAVQQQVLPQAVQTGVLSPTVATLANLALSVMQLFSPA